MKKILTLFFVLFVTVASYAQRDWKIYRYELIGGFGPSMFLGDLGGADKIGRNSFVDLDGLSTRYGGNVGFRYLIYQRLAIQGTISIGMVSGNDKFTQEYFRNDRDLNFRSPIYEFNTRLEYKINFTKTGHIYNLRGVTGQKPFKLLTYIFAGIGTFWFNPQGKSDIDGKWYDLQPLGTEGQRFMQSRPPYSRLNICFPVGLQAKYLANKYWSYSLEVGPRWTLTDYIDDVSKSYVNPAEVANNQPGGYPYDVAQSFADPKYNSGHIGASGHYGYMNEQRGDSFDGDMYVFCMLSVHYKLKAKRNGLPTFKK